MFPSLSFTIKLLGEATVKDMTINPDIKTRVQDVGVNFGFQVL